MLEKFLTPQAILIILISAVGSIYDCKSRRIPNWLTLGSFVLILAYHTVRLNLHDALQCILGLIVGILLLIIPYLMGGMGAGDVKLLGVIGALVGYKDILWIFFYTALCGLVFGVLWIIARPDHLKFLITTGKILPPVDKKQKLPYGVAILFGVIVYLFLGTDKIHLFG